LTKYTTPFAIKHLKSSTKRRFRLTDDANINPYEMINPNHVLDLILDITSAWA